MTETVEKKNTFTAKYGVIYIAGHQENQEHISGGGIGLSGYFFDTMSSVRYANVPRIVTPSGYKPKPGGDYFKVPPMTVFEKAWDLSVDITAKVEKDADNITIFDIFRPYKNRSLQEIEILCLLEALDRQRFDFEHVFIYTSSKFIELTLRSRLNMWAKRDWVQGNGERVPNEALWKLVKERIDSRPAGSVEIKLLGEKEENYAARMAKYATIYSINEANVPWDTDAYVVTTSLTDKTYWEPNKLIPRVLCSKWLYTMAGKPVRDSERVDSTPYYTYMVGDHNKNKEDLDTLGMKRADVSYGYVLYRDDVEIVKRIDLYHNDMLWKDTPITSQSNVVQMINIGAVQKPGTVWEFNNLPISCMWLRCGRRELYTADDTLVSKMMWPALLSYRVVEDQQREYRNVLFSFLKQTGRDVSDNEHFNEHSLRIMDYTDYFYEVTRKANGTDGATKLTENYGVNTDSFRFELENDCVDKKIMAIYTSGHDIPSKNYMSGLTDRNPKVWLVTWKFSRKGFRYGTIIETDDSFALWMGPFTNQRLLTDEDMETK